MTFKENCPIYIQMADRLCDEILAGTYAADERVPGVREYSVLLQVNVNTTVKAYDLLSQRGIIYSRRGMGYFVAPEARNLIIEERKQNFRCHVLPYFIQQLFQLHIPFAEVQRAYDEAFQHDVKDENK